MQNEEQHGEQCKRIGEAIKRTLAIADEMTAIKNSATRSVIHIELDPNHDEPHVTVRKLMADFSAPQGPLPDGSGFMVGKFPLPKDHWLYAEGSLGWDEVRDCNPDMPVAILDNTPENQQAVRTALKYAIRAATMNGKDMDFDPDALILTAIQALTGRGVGPARSDLRPGEVELTPGHMGYSQADMGEEPDRPF